jgi:hypothetical protein
MLQTDRFYVKKQTFQKDIVKKIRLIFIFWLKSFLLNALILSEMKKLEKKAFRLVAYTSQ